MGKDMKIFRYINIILIVFIIFSILGFITYVGVSAESNMPTAKNEKPDKPDKPDKKADPTISVPTESPTSVPTESSPTSVPTESSPTSVPTDIPSSGGNSATSGGNSAFSGGSMDMSRSNLDPYSNIAKYEVREKKLTVNKSVEYLFTTPEFGIYSILVNNGQNDYDVLVRIESLKNTSIHAKPAPGIVYRNENVLIRSTRINYITVKFKIKSSWIEENSLNKSITPYILKWNGTRWLALTTNLTGKDDIYTYFEAPRAGSSRIGIFAISALQKRMNTSNAIHIVEEDIIPEIKEIEETKKIENDVPKFGIIIIMVIVIIGVISLLIYIERKK